MFHLKIGCSAAVLGARKFDIFVVVKIWSNRHYVAF